MSWASHSDPDSVIEDFVTPARRCVLRRVVATVSLVPAGRDLNFRDLSFEGYWFCRWPCWRVQNREKGSQCARCQREMKFMPPLPS